MNQPTMVASPPGVVIPQLPEQPPATLDQRLTHASLMMRVAEYAQQDRMIEAIHQQIEAVKRATEQQKRMLDEGLPPDTSLIQAVDRVVAAINAGGGDPAPAPEWLPDLRTALQATIGANQALLTVLNRVQ